MFAGIFFVVGTIAGIFSVIPSIDSTNYLIEAANNESQVIIGAIFQFVMAMAYFGFAVLIYRNLKQCGETTSIGFISLRIIATIFNILGVIIILLLLILSKDYMNSAPSEFSSYRITGLILKNSRDLINHVAMISVHCISGFMLYYILFKTKLVPRWLSLWGVIGTVITFVTTMMVMFGSIDIISSLYIGLSIPMALVELVFAIWLIAKGYNSLVV